MDDLFSTPVCQAPDRARVGAWGGGARSASQLLLPSLSVQSPRPPHTLSRKQIEPCERET